MMVMLADNNLPMLPYGIYSRPSDERIELLAERLVDIADAQYMSDPSISTETYDYWHKSLNKWLDWIYSL